MSLFTLNISNIVKHFGTGMFDLVFLKLWTANLRVTSTKNYGPCPCLLTSAVLRYRLPFNMSWPRHF